MRWGGFLGRMRVQTRTSRGRTCRVEEGELGEGPSCSPCLGRISPRKVQEGPLESAGQEKQHKPWDRMLLCTPAVPRACWGAGAGPCPSVAWVSLLLLWGRDNLACVPTWTAHSLDKTECGTAPRSLQRLSAVSAWLVLPACTHHPHPLPDESEASRPDLGPRHPSPCLHSRPAQPAFSRDAHMCSPVTVVQPQFLP